MERAFGRSFANVRTHTDPSAGRRAAEEGALAFTIGHHVAFARGAFRPGTLAGDALLAHELAHVIQQEAGEGSLASMAAEDASYDAAEEDADRSAAAAVAALWGRSVRGAARLAARAGPAIRSGLKLQRCKRTRMARNCPIRCDDVNLGTMSSTALFFHASRDRIVNEGDPNATGIGTALHFRASGAEVEDGSACDCDDFKVIQVLETTHPAAGRGNSYVDNGGRNTPFYSDVYLSGEGRHEIPAGYPSAGEEVTTTHSIYDRPYRTTGSLGERDLRWEAEALVGCRKNDGPDRILGGVTYGFSRTYDAEAGEFGPVRGIGPTCRAAPSVHFLDTLRNDPTVSDYEFEGREPE